MKASLAEPGRVEEVLQSGLVRNFLLHFLRRQLYLPAFFPFTTDFMEVDTM
jgi:hypothetical protein